MRLLPPLFLVLALLGPVEAHHCATWSTTENVEYDTGDHGVGPRFYVDNSPPPLPCCVFGSWWVYEESNGLDGLQREDEVIDDTCHGMIEPDTLVL